MDYHEEQKQAFKDLQEKIEWHDSIGCKGRHGVIYLIPKEISGRVNRTLEYFFGNKCGTWKKSGTKGYLDVEFVHMTKIFPPPKRPWEWCGETILFKDWQARETENKKAIAKFDIGDKVYFNHKRQRYEGIVAGSRKRVTVIVGNTKWYVPPRELNHIGG